ncbi:MAG: hypothetical protein KGZ79_08960 [Dethiobacter sp.]|jgi:hypothetical protein|nr:hypothetical protein [Dethiobacter sp.]
MKPVLAAMCGTSLYSIRELAKEEYTTLTNAFYQLNKFAESQQLYQMVKLNYDAIQEALIKYCVQYCQNSVMDWPRIEHMFLDVNRLILNFLSIFRTFLDHSEASIKKGHGKDSNQFRQFKDVCTEFYDNDFSYRFIYKLRNYAQHCGMPVGNLEVSSKLIEPDRKETQHSLKVFFNKEELLDRYDSWGKQLTLDIKKLSDNIEITVHINCVMKFIEIINSQIKENVFTDLKIGISFIQRLLQETEVFNGDPCIACVKTDNEDENKTNVKLEWFPLHHIEMLNRVYTTHKYTNFFLEGSL